MHELGFDVVTKKKGTCVEREDVVKYRQSDALRSNNAPMEEAKAALTRIAHHQRS